MKKIKRLISLAIAVTMIAVLFAGCSAEDKSLMGAMMKNATMTSGESKTSLKFNVNVTGLPSDEQATFSTASSLINSTPFEFTSKFNQSADKTQSSAQIDLSAGMLGSASMWTSNDLTKGDGITVVKIPDTFASFLPTEFKGKQYLVIDTKEIAKDPKLKEAMGKIDYAKLTSASQAMLPKLTQFISNYMDQFNPDLKVITDLGTQKVGNTDVKVYELKLDDASAKALVKYTVSNLIQNKDSIVLLKGFLADYLKAAGATDADLADLQKSFDELEKNGPQMAKEFEAAMDMLKDVQIIGSKGIDIKYAVNSDGYIVNEQGVVDLVLDMAKINALGKIAGTNNTTNTSVSTELDKVVINLGVTFNTDISNINKGDVNIAMPTTNTSNSVGYAELMSYIEKTATPTKPTKPVTPAKPVVKTISATVAKKNSCTIGSTKYITLDSVKGIGGKVTITKKGITISIKGKTVLAKQNAKALTLNGKNTKLKAAGIIVKNKKLYVSVEVFAKAGITIVVK